METGTKVERTFELLQGVDPTMALLLAISVIVPLVVLLATSRTPSLIFVMLVVGSCVMLRWEALNSIGLLGKYPLLIVLAGVSLVNRGRYLPSWFSRAYFVYCGIILLGLFNPNSQELLSGRLAEGGIKIVSYILAYFGIVVLCAKMVANERTSRQLLLWLVVWAIVMICIQFPFWSTLEGDRLTGIYQRPGTLQHSLARSIVILTLFLLSRDRGKWFLPGLAIILTATGLLILTGGRTAIGSVVLAAPFLLRIRPGRAVMLSVVAGIVGSAVLVKVLPTMQGFGDTAAHLTSLESGRYDVWRDAWPAVLEQPFLGHGTNTSEPYAMARFGITLHSSYLDLAYDFGLPVALAFIAVLSLAIWRAWRQMGEAPTMQTRELAALSGALLVMLVVEGFLLSDLVRINLKWFLVCMCLGIQEGVALRHRTALLSRQGLAALATPPGAPVSQPSGGLITR